VRRRRLLALRLLALPFLLAACTLAPRPAPAPAPSPEAAPPAPEAPGRSRFQRRLDAAGIPLRLPPRGKALLVNVPAFEVIAFEDAEPVLRSRAIVGTPRTPTPLIDTHVSTVRIRPSWRPTPSMIASGEYPDRRWPPGPRNPLGLAAIRLEPGLLVYLHDTNRPELFGREMRALSHGCIRIERWAELAAWVLGMPVAELRALAEGGRTLDLDAPPVPVLIRHHTRFPDAAGGIARFPDIYGLGDAGSADARGGGGRAPCRPGEAAPAPG
jgi:murein L,D-transpeptidase YcbB/YkuD